LYLAAKKGEFMATISIPVARPLEDRFFVAMAGVCAIIAFAGFAQTYWLQVPAGTFVGSPLVHLHGLLFSAWTLFFLSQATLIAYGRFLNHRAWGLFGIALATAMLFTGVMVAVGGLQHRIEQGYGDAGRAFLIVPFSAMLLFAGFVTAAILNRRRSDWHKRLMLLATVSLLNAPIARFFFLAATGGGPGMRPGMGPPRSAEFALMPALIGDLVIVLAMLFDWRTRGRVHPAFAWGLGTLLAVQLVRIPISKAEAWLGFADFLARFSG
jgi:hypothetical protein